METFCYRLSLDARSAKFTTIYGSDRETNLLKEDDPYQNSFRMDGWFVVCTYWSNGSNAPNKCQLHVEYTDPDNFKRVYKINHTVYNSGELFLCRTSRGKPFSVFRYHDIRSALFALTGITALYYAEIADEYQLSREWKTPVVGDNTFSLSWCFTDGTATFFLEKGDDSINVGGFDDVALNDKQGYHLTTQIKQATWAVAVHIARTENEDYAKICPDCTLYVQDEDAAARAIPELRAYLEAHEVHDFCELLYSRLP